MVKPDTPAPDRPQPLSARTILVTRAPQQAAGLVELLESAGASVIEAPVIDFVEPDTWDAADRAIANLDHYGIVIFTSANAAGRFHRRMQHLGCAMPPGGSLRVIAIGPATARSLAERGLAATDVAAASRAEGVLDLLPQDLHGIRILIPRALVAAELLPDGLRDRGAIVDVAPVYRTIGLPIDPGVRDLLASGKVDLVTFTSASSVTHLLAGIGGAANLGGARIAVIGPVTARAAREAGLDAEIVARETGMASFAEAIVSAYSNK